MPFYIVALNVSANSVAGSEQASATLETGASAVRFCQCLFNPSGVLTAGGIRVRLASFATAGSGGAAPAGIALDFNNAASTLLGAQGSPVATPGTGTRRTHLSVGADQRGPSAGVWAARN